MTSVGRLKEVELRTVWEHEARDFTPWLLKNIDLLESVTGLPLETESFHAEQSAGRFKVDLIGSTSSGRRVVIENQLEGSDHIHLGQLITYAASYDADVAIWVCKSPRPEHTEAVNWLNKRPECDFFLVKLSAHQIDDSCPAPLFTLIAGPGELTEVVRSEDARRAAQQEQQAKFWQTLLELDGTLQKRFATLSPQRSGSIALSQGLPAGCSLMIVVRNSRTGVMLYIDNRGSRDTAMKKNAATFEYLLKHKVTIEAEFGESLLWDNRPGISICAVRHELDAGGLQNLPDQWREIAVNTLNAAYRLDRALKRPLESFKPAS